MIMFMVMLKLEIFAISLKNREEEFTEKLILHITEKREDLRIEIAISRLNQIIELLSYSTV